MLSAELAADIKFLLLELKKPSALFDGLEQIRATNERLNAPMLRIAHAGNELNPGANELHGVFARTRDLLPKMSMRAFFKAIDEAGSTLDRFLAGQSDPTGKLYQLREELDEFAVAFEKFSTDQTAVVALPVLRLGSRLLVAFEMFLASYSGILETLQSGLETNEDEEKISFYFSGEFSLGEIAQKLAALNEIIETCASLVHGDAAGSSSRVLRLESGSLIFDLAVLKTVASILKSYLSAATEFAYRNYTVEGRIRSMPSDAKAAIKSAMDVRALLVKAKIDTTGMDEQLEIAGSVMAENVVKLLKNQVGFKIGEQEFRAPKSNLRLDRTAVPLELPSPTDEPQSPNQR